MSAEQINIDFNRIFYQGGLQKHFEKNYAEKYAWNVMVDAGDYCLNDFASKELSQSELDCFKNYHFKNQVLLRLNYE